LQSSLVARGPQPIVSITYWDMGIPETCCNATHKGHLNILTASPVCDSEQRI